MNVRVRNVMIIIINNQFDRVYNVIYFILIYIRDDNFVLNI